MRCPSCGRELPIGKIDCPFCESSAHDIHTPAAIVPGSGAGGPALGLAAGALVAVLGAVVWAWLVALTDTLHVWPAAVIGAGVGLAVRLTGGGNPTVRGLIALACAVLGIAGGAGLIAWQNHLTMDQIAAVANFANVALVFVGLSLARSLSGEKKKFVVTEPNLRRAVGKGK